MRLADLTAERASYYRMRRELTSRLAAEERRLKLLREEAVPAPTTGLVWSLGIADGARVSRGDVLGEFADCGRSYVEATLPARGFDIVRPGDEVRVRLSSPFSRTAEEVPGTVRSLRGAGAAGTAASAASVERTGSGLIKVVVDVDQAALVALSSGRCQIGRSATVLF